MGRAGRMSAGLAHARISKQRVRNRVFIALVAVAAMLDAAIVVLIVAAATRSRAGAMAAAVVVAVAVLVSVVDATSSAGRPRRHSREAAEDDRLQRVAVGVAERLGMPPPAVWILNDDAVN